MSETLYILDASAVLAIIFEEPGVDTVEMLVPAAWIGAVNLAEVVTKLQDRSMDEARIDQIVAGMNLAVMPFDGEQAIVTGKLRARTRGKGLSLGDRACIALAIEKGATVVTADRVWAELDLPVPVLLIR